MSTPVTLPGTYTMIIESANNADPTLQWRTTIEFNYPTPPVLGNDLPAAWAGVIVACTRSDSSIIKKSLYNWARGRQPYPDGFPLEVDTTVVPGTAAANWPHLSSTYVPPGGEVVLRVDHEPNALGKPGRNFFRGLLGTGDVSSLTGGKWKLNATIANLNLDWHNILGASGASAFLGSPASGKMFVIVRYSRKLNTVNGFSTINAMNVIGVTTSKQTRKNPK